MFLTNIQRQRNFATILYIVDIILVAAVLIGGLSCWLCARFSCHHYWGQIWHLRFMSMVRMFKPCVFFLHIKSILFYYTLSLIWQTFSVLILLSFFFLYRIPSTVS